MALRSDQRAALTVGDESILAQRMRIGHLMDVGHEIPAAPGSGCYPCELDRFRMGPAAGPSAGHGGASSPRAGRIARITHSSRVFVAPHLLK